MTASGTAVFQDAVYLLGDALGLEFDEVVCEAEYAATTEDLDLGSWRIPAGCVAGVAASWPGRIGGRTVVDLRVRWRKGRSLDPDWRLDHGYLIEIDGRPTIRTKVDVLPPPDFRGTTFGDFMVLGMILTAMPAVNAIPNVVAAPPGIVTYTDLPLPLPAGSSRVDPRPLTRPRPSNGPDRAQGIGARAEPVQGWRARSPGSLGTMSIAEPITPAPPPAHGPCCPVCGAATPTILSTAGQTAVDVRCALARGDKLMHDYAADVFDCESCGTLFRDPASVPADLLARYRDDTYEPAELERLWRNGVDRCRHTAGHLVGLGLRPGTSVLEIGSYAGAFLTFARELGCDGVGVDIGRDVNAFARSHGLDVLDGPFWAESFGAQRFDSVWILNCFEQLPDVEAVLDGVASLLEPDGRLVIRTPNADFIRAAYRSDTDVDRQCLTVNGLLGVPFSKCLNPFSLVGLLAEHGFGSFRAHGHRLGSDVDGRLPAWGSPWIDVAATVRQPRGPDSIACTASIASASAADLSSR